MHHEEEGGEDDYEYFDVPEDFEEDPREAYVKRMIKEKKDQDGFLIRPDYKPGSLASNLDEKEYVTKKEEEGAAKEEEPPKKEKKKEEYDL